jgi:hypothetical protein
MSPGEFKIGGEYGALDGSAIGHVHDWDTADAHALEDFGVIRPERKRRGRLVQFVGVEALAFDPRGGEEDEEGREHQPDPERAAARDPGGRRGTLNCLELSLGHDSPECDSPRY